MGKYDHINFRPPKSIADAAERGLELRRKNKGRGGLSSNQAKSEGVGSGVQRAVNLKNRNNLSPSTVRRMKAFFDRHRKNKKVDKGKKPEQDRGFIAWNLWGGDAGYAWSRKIVRQMDAVDKKARNTMIDKLIKLADSLDAKGFYKYASEVDDIIKEAVSRSGLIKALKGNDPYEVRKEFGAFMRSLGSHDNPAYELGLDNDQFKEFSWAVSNDLLYDARQIMGIGEPVDLTDTNKINPFTGQPWPSGPVDTGPARHSVQYGEFGNLVGGLINIVKSRGGKIKKVTDEGEDNLLRIEFSGLSGNDIEDIEEIYAGGGSFKDDLYGYGHYNIGMIDDGPDLGIEIETFTTEEEAPPMSLFNAIYDLLK